MKFKTPAGALMFFLSQGWEMYLNGATSNGSSTQGNGFLYTSSYWILRKPCSKEEFENAVQEAIVHEELQANQFSLYSNRKNNKKGDNSVYEIKTSRKRAKRSIHLKLPLSY